MKYDLKMIYFTLNMAETKSGRVETVTNGLEIGFPSRISHQSREAAGAEGSRTADVPRGTIRGRRVCRGLGSRRGLLNRSRVSGRSRVTGWPGWRKNAGGLGWVCRRWTGLACFGLKRLGWLRCLGSIRVAGSGPRVELRLLHSVAYAFF